MKLSRTFQIVILGMAMCAQPAMSQVASSSSKPIKLIVPFAAGGPVDAAARAVGDGLSRALGQSVIVENKPGANTIIGASACKAAAPDGQTFCVFLNDTVTINPSVYGKLPYDPERDFVAVASLVGIEAAIVVAADLPVSNLKELAQFDASHPGKLNWGTFGTGSSAHLYLGQVNRALKAQINHIPYTQGGAAVVAGLVSGDIQSSMLSYGLVNQWIQKGKLKAVAVIGDSRSPYFPDVRTVKEQGLGLSTKAWIGMFAPSGIPAAAVEQMNQAVNRVLMDPAFQKQHLETQGFTPIVSTPKEFADRTRKDRAEWAAVAAATNVRLD
jgi:tripartite-type tricarboxylate transporter receptor subunit TctC